MPDNSLDNLPGKLLGKLLGDLLGELKGKGQIIGSIDSPLPHIAYRLLNTE